MSNRLVYNICLLIFTISSVWFFYNNERIAGFLNLLASGFLLIGHIKEVSPND